ncbi:DUF4153 domain-containing protein [Mucilaginibacter sp. PAMB04274]|uniref:DUF4153 domain-containing protein n=1 Tax=Mucilaginibacter sp. PAMB04274 TaxID=3138568 RepID=UPI0031F60489
MAFKLPSINRLFNYVVSTIKRFPFEFLFALAGTWSAVSLSSSYLYGYVTDQWYARTLMMAAIGMPLSLAVSLYKIHKGWPDSRLRSLRYIAAGAAVSFLFIFKPEVYPQHYIHFALLFIAMHLLVSFAAFTGKGNTLAFWHFNKTIFIRLLTGLLYSLVLGAGLSAAFGVVDNIFGVNLNWNYLRYIWILIFGLFNTLFFLAGIPEQMQNADAVGNYPKGLKFFSQYILIPLASIYLAILLAYEVKILVEWTLPKGLVSALILGYAGLGLLAMLLVYPLRDQEGNGWIRVYSRYFYMFLLPLVVLLILAVTKRIDSYGITQYRYFLIVLAAWLLFLIGYFLFYKKATIKAIPISLFLIIMLIIYGPQSATTVSLNSQRAILLNLFAREKLVKQGKLMPVDERKVKPYTAVRMASTLDYILKRYDFQALQPLLGINLEQQENTLRKSWQNNTNIVFDEDSFKIYRTNWVQSYLKLGGYEYRQQYSEEQLENELNTNYYIHTKEALLNLKGYDYMLVKETYADTVSIDTVSGYLIRQGDSFEYDSMILNIGKNKFNFLVTDLAKQIMKQTENLKPYEDQSTPQGLDKRYLLPQKMLRLSQTKSGITVMAQVQEMSFDYTKKYGVRVNSVRAYYFIKFNK